jgi:hypothetical protein
MTNKEKTLKQIERVYNDSRNWTPPSIRFIAGKLDLHTHSVFRWLQILRKEGRIK